MVFLIGSAAAFGIIVKAAIASLGAIFFTALATSCSFLTDARIKGYVAATICFWCWIIWLFVICCLSFVYICILVYWVIGLLS